MQHIIKQHNLKPELEELLLGKMDDIVLYLKNPSGNYYWETVDERILSYYIKHVSKQVWNNQIAISIICLTDRQLTPISILNMVTTFNARFRDLFSYYELTEFNQLAVNHIEEYLTKQIFATHSDRQRQSLLTIYNTFFYNLSKWYTVKFEESTYSLLKPYILFKLPFDNRDFGVRNNAINTSKAKRKEDSSAVTPLLPKIRAEANIRYNQIRRLRTAYQNALKHAMTNNITFPIEFDYEEPDYIGEKWFFRIHDIRSILPSTPYEQRYPVEFLYAENTTDKSEGQGIWFIDLIKLRLLGNWNTEYVTKEHGDKVMNFLDQWGYIEKENIIPNPFSPRNKGLLIPGFHVSKAASILNSHLFSIEPIFIACMFAHFAINIITSSGARMNELLQISYDKECCVITIDRSNKQHKKNFILRLTPKGREEPENYYVPEEIFKTMHEIIEELKLHYKDQKLPKVKYEVEARKHILMDERRFVFQYNDKHLNVFTINSIIKFLLHGIIIEDSPQELKDMYEDYKDKVGTLSKVTGGICTIDSVGLSY